MARASPKKDAVEKRLVKLVTWNCCSGPLARKLSDLASLEADIAVVPECPRIPEQPGATVWVGARPKKGLAVFAGGPWQVHRARAPRGLPRYALPVQVSGPESFLLLAIWAQPHPTVPYVRGMHRAVRACRPLMSGQPRSFSGISIRIPSGMPSTRPTGRTAPWSSTWEGWDW